MNQASKKINEARSKIEIFYKDMYGENAASSLEDGLIELKDVATSSEIECELSLIQNLMNGVFQTIISEAGKLRNIRPLAKRKDVEHWLEIMRIPYNAGWALSEAYKQALMEHRRLLSIIKEFKGYISEEYRFLLFEMDASDI